MFTSLRTNATALALMTAVISGVAVFANKFAVGTFSDPVVFTTAKNLIVAVFLIGLILSLGKWQEIRSLTTSQWKRLSAIGIVGGSLPFALFFTGLTMMPAANAAIIHKTLFVWVALLAIFFLKEKLTRLQWLGVSLLFASNLVIGGFQGFSYGIGELMVFAATILWAVENVIARKTLAEVSSVTVASARMVLGSGILLAFLAVSGRATGFAEMSSGSLWIVLLVSALLTGYVLSWYTALKYGPAPYVAALLVPASLITNVLSAVFITGTITEALLTSGALVFLGTALVVLFTKQKETGYAIA